MVSSPFAGSVGFHQVSFLLSYHMSFRLTHPTSCLDCPASPPLLPLQPGPLLSAWTMGRLGCQGKPEERPGEAMVGISNEVSPTGSRIFLGCICPGAEVAKDKPGPDGHTVDRDPAVLSPLGELGPGVMEKSNSCTGPFPAPSGHPSLMVPPKNTPGQAEGLLCSESSQSLQGDASHLI